MPLSCMNTIPETTLFIELVISQNSQTKIWNYHQVLISRGMTRNLLSEHSALILSEPVLLAADSLEQLSSLFNSKEPQTSLHFEVLTSRYSVKMTLCSPDSKYSSR